jgi:hypothetical protein
MLVDDGHPLLLAGLIELPQPPVVVLLQLEELLLGARLSFGSLRPALERPALLLLRVSSLAQSALELGLLGEFAVDLVDLVDERDLEFL